MSKKKIWLPFAIIVIFVMIGSYLLGSYERNNTGEQFSSTSDTDSSFSSPSSTQSSNTQTKTEKSFDSNQIPTSDRMTNKKQQMIYRADIHMQAAKLLTAKNQVEQIAKQHAASMVSSSDAERANERYIRLTYNVPQNKFQAFLDHIKKISDTPPEIQINGEDVSEELVDLQSRIKAKKAMENRLISMMNKATTTSDLLDIENTLGNVQEQLEQLTGRQQYLQYRVAFSTVTIEITSSTYQPLQTKHSFINQIIKSFIDSCSNMWTGLQVLVIWLAQALPYLIILGVIWLIVYLIRRKKRSS